jgi:hypothetical protein
MTRFLSAPLLLICCVAPLASQGPTPPMTAAEAEAVASKWWKQYRFKFGERTGAAWRWERGQFAGWCVVGIADGKMDRPGHGTDGGPGFYRPWEARYRAPDGRYYKNVDWFGKGRIWELALYDAINNGYPPLDAGGNPARWHANLFCLRINKPPYYLSDGRPFWKLEP